VRSILASAAVTTVAAAVLLSSAPAETARTVVPASRVGYHLIVVKGARLRSITHSTSTGGSTITGSDLYLAGNLTKRTVQEHFGTGVAVVCQFISQAGHQTRFRCAGLNQPTNAASTLTIEVSSPDGTDGNDQDDNDQDGNNQDAKDQTGQH
jgi:hypothetical protein